MAAASELKLILARYRKLLGLRKDTASRTIRRRSSQQTVLLLSPHPDDEVLMGGLALRLQRENKLKVINVAVTLGSLPARKKARQAELAQALKKLKWQGHTLPDDWSAKAAALAKLLKRYRPVLVIAPHADDHHPTHVRTAQLLLDQLKTMDLTVAWSEYWKALAAPNLLLELSEEHYLEQVKALACHAGEIERNPYHLRLMGQLIDNVRRGSEVLAGSGSAAAPMLLAQLYRLERWERGTPRPIEMGAVSLAHDVSDWL